jgi:tryptophanyl-tRNA synthetase
MTLTAPVAPTAGSSRTARRLTGLTPSGHLQLGNLFGAIRPMVAAQQATTGVDRTHAITGMDRTHASTGVDRTHAITFISDLHALTLDHDPRRLRAITVEHATLLLAAGLDPARSILYAQSQLREHTELHYLLECATGYGEAHRMIQFKEKSAGQAGVRLSLLTYPVLMAADILLHDIDEVPVGEDQSQHLELARDVAIRFNDRYGATFVVPRAVNPGVAARIMDLTDPTRKMSKSQSRTDTPAGTLFLLDPPDVLRRKVMRAVTDGEREVRYDPVAKPGVANLLEILAACHGGDPAELAAGFAGGYGALKAAVADAVCEELRPIQARYAELAGDPGYVRGVLADGAERVRDRAAATVGRARQAIGLL